MRSDIAAAMRVGDKSDPILQKIKAQNVAIEEQAKIRWLLAPMIAAAMWVRCGCPRIVMSHKMAASLMATDIPPDAGIEVRAPWPAFAVDIPHGIAPYPYNVSKSRTPVYSTTAFVAVSPEYSIFVLSSDSGRGYETVEKAIDFGFENSACSGLGGMDLYSSYGHGSNESGYETVQQFLSMKHELPNTPPAAWLAARLAVCAAIEVTQQHFSSNRSSSGGHCSHERANRNNRNQHARTFEIKRDIKVDCREYVKDFCLGKGSSPNVQRMVRGHPKRQPFGPGREQRKIIFVEPYMRGPEDAPFALRSHIIGRQS